MAIFGRSKEKETPKTTSEKVAKSVVKKEAAKKEPVKKEVKKVATKKTVEKHVAKEILVKPLITEKVTDLAAHNQYVFAVHKNVNKIEVKNEIKKNYKVEPIKINMVTVKGKNVRFGRTIGKRKDWKKAIVILKKGDTINVGKESK